MMRSVVRWWLGLVLLVAWQHALGEVRDMQMRFLGIEDGLSHQTVTCFCQDEFGFIWIGTADGLNRYDGQTVDIFLPDNNPYSISSNNILQLESDGNGAIYLRSNRCVERYDLRLKRFEVLYDGDVQAMAVDGESLYLIAKNHILCCQPQQGVAPQFESLYAFDDLSLPHDDLGKLAITKRGLVVSSAKMGLVEVVDGQITHQEPVQRVYGLHYDADGYLWVTTRGDGLYRFDEDWHALHFTHREGDATSLLHNNVRSIVPCGKDLYYVGSLGGLQQLDLQSGKFTLCTYEMEANLKMRSIFSMFVDRNGTLWMGTFHDGVHYYHPANDSYRFYRSVSINRRETALPLIGAIAEDLEGNLWLGTEGSGLLRFSPQSEQFSLFDKIASDEVIKALYYDASRNELWASTITHGIYCIHLHDGRMEHIGPEVFDVFTGQIVGNVYNLVCVIEDGRGDLLFGCSEGLVRLDRRQKRFEALDNEAIFRRKVSQVWDVVRADDRLWIATSLDLIALQWESGKVHYYTFADISGRNTKQYISHLHIDRHGTLWLGSTGSGVYRYHAATDSFEAVGGVHKEANRHITALAAGVGESVLYMADSYGFSWLDKEGRVERYPLAKSFPLTHINYNGLYAARDGHLYICGPQGAIRIHRSRFETKAADYRITIKDIRVDDREVMPLDSLNLMAASALYQQRMVLPSRHSSITFCFAHNNHHKFPATELEYCLEGFDGAFRKADASGTATYMNLAPGLYRFVVRGERDEATRCTPEASFELRVRAPLVARPWFQVSLLLVLLVVAWRVYRSYLRRQQLEQLLSYEQREKQHLEQINAQKLRFFTNISHEFRTPLTLIAGQIELLLARQDIETPIYNKVLSIYRNTHRMQQMVDEAIDFRRFDQSSLRLAVCRGDLSAVAKEVWLSFYDLSVQHQIDFRFEAPQSPVEAEFDRKQVERVLNNLLSNAFKYTSEQGAVVVTLTADDEQVTIRVTDTGVGIDAKHLVHIFDRFWRDEQTNAAVTQQGSGIGLSLVKNIVEMHGGTIRVASTVGRGSQFEVTLPRVVRRDNPNVVFVEAETTADNPLLPEMPVAIPEEFGGERPQLLVVEDNEEMRDLLQQLFEPTYRVSLAVNGAEGVEKARREQPDLVLSDVMMPVMSGFELCERLKTDFETSHIPVVLLTAYNAEEHTLEGFSKGADDYVAKPFNARILLARCNNILVQRRRLQARFGETVDVAQMSEVGSVQDAQLLTDAVAIIEEHLSEPEFNIHLLARALGLSRTVLFAKLKGLTGQAPNEFILSIRFKKALHCLETNPEMSVADIAYQVGFSTPSYFISRFRSRYGVTPKAYRKQRAEAENVDSVR